MSEWQPIETAPADGKPILLYLDPPLDTRRTLGYSTPGEMRIVVGWNTGARYRDGSLEWNCGFCDEGIADTEGHAPVYQIAVTPTHWMPLPEPPSD